MELTLTTILPNISTSLDGTGFLFGAGTSVEAGYPMMAGLTRKVISELTPAENLILKEALDAINLTYDDTSATPNIEELSDIIIAHAINSHDSRFSSLENRFRALIIQTIISVKTPCLDNHVQFFQALSRRTFGRACTIWIFTTNYDLLFEIAATKAGVFIENGFSGCIDRFFNPNIFRTIRGEIVNQRFTPNTQLVVKLVKLHGSISWISEEGKIFERHPDALTAISERNMILPRCKKIVETLDNPYDVLFRYTKDILGTKCRYLVCCGFSFSDEHINQHIILPILQSGRVRLFTLNEFEPFGVSNLKNYQSFCGSYSNASSAEEIPSTSSSELWKFSKFTNLF